VEESEEDLEGGKMTIVHPRGSMGRATGERGCDPAGTYYEHHCDNCGDKAMDDEFVDRLILSDWRWCGFREARLIPDKWAR
jgi:hypothetical protein